MGIVQEIENWRSNLCKPESVLENKTNRILWDLEIKTDHPIPPKRLDPVLINKKKKTNCCLVNFVIPVNHKLEIKESEKINNYLQENSKCWLCGDSEEMINHKISECSRLAQKEYKIRHDWVGKVIHWELCKKFKFDHIIRWCVHKSEPVQGNEMYKIFWDFEMPNRSQNPS